MTHLYGQVVVRDIDDFVGHKLARHLGEIVRVPLRIVRDVVKGV